MTDLKILYPADVYWEAYRALRLEALREEPQAFGSSYEENLQLPDTFWQGRLAQAVEGRTSWMLFARQHDHLVGMVGAYQTEAMMSQNIAFVVAVYVTAAARGQGISRHLMLELLDLLKQTTSIRRVRLTVNVAQTEAVRLYERLGFATLCSENGRLGDGKYYDEYIMERDLG
jgi:ribosomal protein S18 acetylase RimI-like enzyme